MTSHAHAPNARYPLSPFQLAFYRDYRRDPTSSAWNRGTAMHLVGPVDVDAFRRAWMRVVERHEGMRTVYRTDGERSFQEIVTADERSFEVASADDTREPSLRAQEVIDRPFDLQNGPTVRGALLCEADGGASFVIVNPHIQADFSAVDTILFELGALYTEELGGAPADLPDVRPFGAFVERQLAELREREAALQSYWQSELGDSPPEIALPTDFPRQAGAHAGSGSVTDVVLDEASMTRLKALRQSTGTTSFRFLLAAWYALLLRYSRQGEVTVGMSVNCAPPEFAGAIGNFANVVGVRVQADDGTPFSTLVRAVTEKVGAAQAHRDYPLEWTVNKVLPAERAGRAPFETIFGVGRLQRAAQLTPVFLTRVPVRWTATLGPLTVDRAIPVNQHGGDVALELLCVEVGGQLGAQLVFDRGRFSEDTARRILAHYARFLRTALGEFDKPLGAFDLLDESERIQVRDVFAKGAPVAHEAVPLHAIIERRAAENPRAVAIEFDGEAVSYGELDARANRIARHLANRNVTSGDRVAVVLRRSARVPTAFLATWKAGAAYAPVDPTYPPGRIANIFEDAAPRLAIVEAETRHLVPEGTPIIDLDADAAGIDGLPGDALEAPAIDPDALAYLIFTSGTSGRPKGVMIGHRGVVSYAADVRARWKITASSRVHAFASFSFDSSVADVYGTLTAGGTLVIRPDTLLGGAELFAFLADQRVTHAQLPPAVLTTLPAGDLPSLHVVVVSGDVCPADLTARWAGRVTMLNEYGPTEITVCATSYVCRPGEVPPIGKPITNVEAYVLEESGKLAPIGVPGDLHLTGVGLARGYAAQEELSRERFVTVDVGHGPRRMYRTGDLVRWRSDGNLTFLGRIDEQVKIRGCRIELGEVLDALRSVPGVDDAVVSVRELPGRGKQIVAYYTSASRAVDPSKLRDSIRRVLPGFMVPSHFVALETIPLNAHGKVDHRALPSPETIAPLERVQAPSAVSDTTATITAIFRELLNRDDIGADDAFFDVGGDSLMAVELAGLIGERLGEEISVAMVFESPTARRLAGAIGEGKAPVVTSWLRDKPGPVIVLVSPIGGHARIYDGLAHALGTASAVLAVTVIDNQGDPESMVRDIAAAVAAQVQHRPVWIAGWSSGGLLALHVAHRLADELGESVMRGLTLIDAHTLSDASRASAFAAVLPSLGRLGDMLLPVDPSDLESAAQGWRELDDDGRRREALAFARDRGIDVHTVDLASVATEADVIRQRLEQLERLPSPGKPLKLTYVRASKSPIDTLSRLRTTHPELEERVVAGNHYDVVLREAVQVARWVGGVGG